MNSFECKWFRQRSYTERGFAAARALAVAISGGAIAWSPRGVPAREDISEPGSPLGFVPKFKVDRLIAQYFDGQRLYGTEHKFVYTSEDLGKTWHKLGYIGSAGRGMLNTVRGIVGRSEIFRRIARPKGIWGLLALHSGTILAYCNPCIYRSTDGGLTFDPVHSLRMDPEPKAMMHSGWCEDAQGNVYYGEYGGTGKGDTQLMKSVDDGKSWQTVFTFPDKSVRHIHAVQYDEHGKHLWVTTGDLDPQCRIAYSDDGGRNFTVIGEGKQKWRATSLLFTSDYVYWGMDAPKTTSQILRWHRATRNIEELALAGGPVFYSERLQNGAMLMATTMEKPGPYVSDRMIVWYSRDGTTWISVAGFDRVEKEYSVRFLGVMLFPLGKPLPHAIFSPVSVKGIDFATYTGDIRPVPMPTSTAPDQP